MTDLDPEIIEALRMIEEIELKRVPPFVEHRLYYRKDGTISMFCSTNHPVTDDNYIVLSDPDMFYKSNTVNLRVMDRALVTLNPRIAQQGSAISKSTTGQPVVKNNAALALNSTSEYENIEHYDRKTNS